MSNRNFEKARRQANMSNRGYEPARGSDLAFGLPKTVKSKAQQSTEAAALIAGAMMTKEIACPCGHRGTVRIPVEKASGSFRCVKCLKRI